MTSAPSIGDWVFYVGLIGILLWLACLLVAFVFGALRAVIKERTGGAR